MPRGPARDAGLKARHALKEARQAVTCRYIDLPPGGLCGTEVVDPDGEIRLCVHHLALTLELLRRSPLVDALLNQPRRKVA